MNALFDDSGLVPDGLGYNAVAPFLFLTLSMLYMLGTEPSVQQYTQANPQAHRAIRALSTAVAQAGGRVRDTTPHGNSFDDHLELFTAEEFWMFDLAFDVVDMFATTGGLGPDARASVISGLRNLDEDAHGDRWKSQVREAGDGPAEFRELRAHIPRNARTPEGLVPRGLGASAVASFIGLTLATLDELGREPSVQQYTDANPDAHRAIRALGRAVAEAGIRVRDTARYKDDPRMFTAEEFWMFDLAIDVIAMFVTGGGLRPDMRARFFDDLRLLDQDVCGRHWKKEVHKAGDGPAEFRELRAHIPRHEPHPK